MCGIGGILPSNGTTAGECLAAAHAMVRALRHRGPDAEGVLDLGRAVLGHTRLSILDLSAAGNQPFTDPTGRYTLVYNGEVYNYCELRQELRQKGYDFRSSTDTEVVLHAFRQWGEEALQRFNGMWAFAIWDAESAELFAARDRAGKKPFYYARDGAGSWYFASEIKALIAAGLRFGYDDQAAFDFLTQGTYGHLGARGFFRGVEQLPAAHFLRVRPTERPRLTRYWEIPIVPQQHRQRYGAGAREEFRALLSDAVRIRLRADVPVGATLSGGLDSSTIVLLRETHDRHRPLHLFTSLYPGSRHDETPYFDAIVARIRDPIVHRVAPEPGNWRETLCEVLQHQEEPFGDTSILAHHRLMRAAREAGVPVILSGQGGDELLIGYPSLVNALLGHYVRRGHVRLALQEALAWSAGAGIAPSRTLAAALLHAMPRQMHEWLRQLVIRRYATMVNPDLVRRVSLRRFDDDARRDPFARYAAQVFTRFAIPHLVHYDDRNAMAFAVEGRMPFLDHRLVEFVQGLEQAAFLHAGRTKRILRESFADLLPSIVRDRRDKVGFYTPLAEWLRVQGDWVSEVMAPDQLREVGVLRPRAYRARLATLRQGDDSAALDVWRGLIFHLWIEHFQVETAR